MDKNTSCRVYNFTKKTMVIWFNHQEAQLTWWLILELCRALGSRICKGVFGECIRLLAVYTH